MENQELFQNLVQLAAVDGKFTEEEIRFLVVRAERWGIPNAEFETALASTDSDVELTIPTEKPQRIEMLREMIRLMAVDGELADVEKRLCAAASACMEITSDEFTAIVNGLIAE